MDSRFFTLEQTAEYLALPMSKVYAMSAAGEIPGKVKLGSRTVRVDRRKLDAWLEEKMGGDEE